MGPPPKSILNAEDEEEGLSFRLFSNKKDLSLDDGMDVDGAAPCSGSLFEDWEHRWQSTAKARPASAAPQRTELRVSAPHHRVEYVGKDSGETSMKNDAAKFAIGVINKRTNTIQLVPIPGIYCMEQSVVGYEPKMPADLSVRFLCLFLSARVFLFWILTFAFCSAFVSARAAPHSRQGRSQSSSSAFYRPHDRQRLNRQEYVCHRLICT